MGQLGCAFNHCCVSGTAPPAVPPPTLPTMLPSQRQEAGSSGSDGTPMWAIVGIAILGLASLLFLVLIVAEQRKRKRERKDEAQWELDSMDKESAVVAASASKEAPAELVAALETLERSGSLNRSRPAPAGGPAASVMPSPSSHMNPDEAYGAQFRHLSRTLDLHDAVVADSDRASPTPESPGSEEDGERPADGDSKDEGAEDVAF